MYSKYVLQRRKIASPTKKRRENVSFTGSITRIGQGGIMNSTGNTSKQLSDVVIVIMQGRGRNDDKFGVAIHDVRYPDVDLCEFVDSREYIRLKTMIHINKAFDIIIQNGNDEKGNTKLLGEALATAFNDALLQSISSKYFKPEKGEKLLNSMMNEEVSTVSNKIREHSLALGAFAVLLKYIHETRLIFFRLKSLRVREIAIDDTCMIEIVDTGDCSKIRKMQLKQRRHLLSVLDHTITVNGGRLLRSNVLQPTTDLEIIESRLDAVSELNEQPQLLNKLRNLLTRAHELDKVMAMCIQTTTSWTVRGAEANINQILKLFQTMKVIGAIQETLIGASVKSTLLQAKIEFLNDERFEEMIEILEEKIICESTGNKKNSLGMRNMKCFAIKEGVSINLDIARKAYLELLSKVDEIANEELLEKFNDQSTRLSYSQTRGFHYTLVTKNAHSVILPNGFSEVVRNRSTVTFSSRKLTSANDRINQVVAEVFLASDIVVAEVVEKIQAVLPVLYYAMDAISTIDFLCSLATYSSYRDTVRPEFGTSLSISQGRHPILDWADTESTITNDTCLTRDRRFGIITGPNMAGKSTYLKQVAQLAIIAQTGCYIPADYASLIVFKRIFSRMGHNDELMKNKSAFASEMNDASTILKYADKDSLVVLDELARSTSTEEGIAITYAICENILTIGCYALLATHFLDLAVLENHSTAIENYHFRPIPIDINVDKFIYRHKLMRGPYKGPLYGFELVELSTFPDLVLEYATQLAHHLRSQIVEKKRDFEIEKNRVKIFYWNRIKEHAESYMKMFGSNWKKEEEAYKKLQDLKKCMIDELKKIDKQQFEENC